MVNEILWGSSMLATRFAPPPLAQLDRRGKRRLTRHPIRLELEQHSYRSLDWSLAGFGLTTVHRGLAIGERLPALVHDPSGSISGDILCEVIWTDGDRAGFRFLALSPRLRLALQAFAER